MRTRAIAACEYELGSRDMRGRLKVSVIRHEFYAAACRFANFRTESKPAEWLRVAFVLRVALRHMPGLRPARSMSTNRNGDVRKLDFL